jgi:hypothetical protein
MQTDLKINMQTCLEIITDFATQPYTANVDFGSMYFFFHEEDYQHILEHQDMIRTVISPKYQLLFVDFGMKAVVVTLTRNIL